MLTTFDCPVSRVALLKAANRCAGTTTSLTGWSLNRQPPGYPPLLPWFVTVTLTLDRAIARTVLVDVDRATVLEFV